jgi:hypothetical protein
LHIGVAAIPTYDLPETTTRSGCSGNDDRDLVKTIFSGFESYLCWVVDSSKNTKAR